MKTVRQRNSSFLLIFYPTLSSPLDCKEIKPVNPKGNQSWIFIRRTDAEVEAPIFWPPDGKNWIIGKDPDAGKEWRQEKGTREDEMLRWHHWLYGHEFEQALRVGDGQGSLVCCSPWDWKESYMTEPLNWTELILLRTSKDWIKSKQCPFEDHFMVIRFCCTLNLFSIQWYMF